MNSPRNLPRIDDLLAEAAGLVARYGRGAAADALREVVDRTRAALLDGSPAATTADDLIAQAETLLAARRPSPPRKVINATGVVVHTNLGRAPLSAAAVAAIADAAGPCDLEYDLAGGRRGSRGDHVDALIAEACGAQDALAVNNAAGALVLVLAALAGPRGVLVSRGELIEIGGSFRLPDIMAASGARLVEVGTTNRTRAGDYAAAADADADVALVLKVHPSNYTIDGFAESPSVAELHAVTQPRELPLVHDVGSGLLHPDARPWLADEPSMRGSLDAGADLVLCSGDKLLGGPQAGLLAGRGDLIRACRSHPLARALRLDKLRIAALHATLEAHLREPEAELPVWRMLAAAGESLRERAARLAAAVGPQADVCEGESVVGGGSAPGARIPGPVLRLAVASAERAARMLREGDPPVVVRVEDGAVWVDPRTVEEADDALLAARLREAAGA
ncbi:MAG TPA: L-seryl-tRNA(Sec) selenium transferase [Egibacteraceae bacterium]|nr:L-seryl-tRNA(Sec) selenium transferase [Egibacteraceae bacterium]